MTRAASALADPYRTRILCPSSPVHRRDPAVWTGPGAPVRPADAAALTAHSADGYHVVDELLSPAEVQTYWNELVRLSNDENLAADERVIAEKKTGEVRSIFEVHRISPLIAELVRDPRVLDRARQILGSDVYIHQSRVNYMPGFKGTGFYWHSDFETWHAEDGMPLPRAVSCSIALADNYAFNGGLMVMPGSHRTFVPCVGETPADNYKNSLQEQEIGVPAERDIARLCGVHGIKQFTGPAGSALWFDANLMHGSGSNITPFPRSNIFLVFNSVENALVEPFAATAARPSFIASRDVVPITR
ncbi:ectoine hydroxylase [Amycolatopsis rubida]|uniref:Ectoine hydroxylase n=1 Tax=Amycolatopsis rubida TaxID=112413 RepID=A0ABX0BWP0_9PSEU|nr:MULTISPECIES: ectoine hydroxylase [Amycolatopsis]MYW93231.1 ectoine hydroxylase [Amycolatopsis rubida]NEC58218.1 ectoine hydroxylase [Amycolatopsis rubida]OAP26828.1 Phytanoyl-CoA dioxygenase (PhyH) [Amycolatopsis sp. M39]